MKGVFFLVFLFPAFLFAQISTEEASLIIDKLGQAEVVKPNGIVQMQAWLDMESPWRSHVTRGENPIPLGFAGDIILRSDLLTLLGQIFMLATEFRSGEDTFQSTQPRRNYPLTDLTRLALIKRYEEWYPNSPGGIWENGLRIDKGLIPKAKTPFSFECYGLFAEYWAEDLQEDELGADISTTGKSCYRLLQALGDSGLITEDEIEMGKTLVREGEVTSEQCLVGRLHELVAHAENKPVRTVRRTAFRDLLISLGQTNEGVLANWAGDGPLPVWGLEDVAGLERTLVVTDAGLANREVELTMEQLMKKLNVLIPNADFKGYKVKDTLVMSPADPAYSTRISYVEIQDGVITYNNFKAVYEFEILGKWSGVLPLGVVNQALITRGSPFRLRTTGIGDKSNAHESIKWLLTEKEWTLLDQATNNLRSTDGSLWRDTLVMDRLQIIHDLKSIGLLPTLSPLAKKRAFARMANLPKKAFPSEVGATCGLELLTLNVEDTLTPTVMLKWVQQAETLAKGAFTILPNQQKTAEEVIISIAGKEHLIPIDGRSKASVLWLYNLNEMTAAAGFGEFHLAGFLPGPITYCFLSKTQAEDLMAKQPTFFWLERVKLDAGERGSKN